MWDSYFSYYATGILLIPAILFTLYAQMKVKSNFSRYSRIRNDRNLTGATLFNLKHNVLLIRFCTNLSQSIVIRKLLCFFIL